MRSVFIILYCTPLLCMSQKIKPYAPELFPTQLSGAVCGYMNNGETIIFIREDSVKGKLLLYQAQRKGAKWANAELLPFSGNYNDMGARLSPDGKILYFTSDRPGGSSRENDQWNIWKSEWANGTWSAPEPITIINNKGSECCPLPMKDGTLMFSADRGKPEEWWMYSWDGKQETVIDELTYQDGWQWPSYFIDSENLILFNSMKRNDTYGMDDIYVSFYKNNTWTAPINLGEPINTKVYEDGAILSHDGKWLIFNQHTSGVTPSQVMCVEWKSVLKKLKK